MLAPSAPRGRALSPDEEERTHVLLAEDDDELRKLFARTLRDAGFEVHTAVDGAEVLSVLVDAERASAQLPHAIVMDVKMPRQSGIDTLRELRSLGFSQPVVLVTGFGDPALRATAADLGASVVLDKPVDRDDLVAVVELVIRTPRGKLDS